MKLYKALSLLLLSGLLLAACAPGAVPATGITQTPVPVTSVPQTDIPPTPQDGGVPQPEAADAAQQALAEHLGIDPGQLVLSDIEQVEWTDSCLGAGRPEESCLQVITPGFRLVFEANNQRYEVRTNQDGSLVRIVDDLPEGVPGSGQVLPAVAAAQAALAQQTGVALERIRLVEATPVEWTDSCLGAGRPEESCLQVITPGWRIILEADGVQYLIHTNQDGSIYRFVDLDDQGALPVPDPAVIVNSVQKQLAQQLGIAASQITMTSLEAVEWPNACLGVSLPEQVCAEVITPGYRLVFEAQGVQYVFHSDDTGGVILPAIPPLPETAIDVVKWEQAEGGDCAAAEIGADGVSYGACEAEQQQADLSPERVLELAYFYAAFSPFDMETPAGTVQFSGQGARQPNEAEMRSVAEWAKLVSQEAEAGQESADAGVALVWSREGGIAGFCDGLAVSMTGWAVPSTCRGETPANLLSYRMNADELEKLYAWTDALESFEYEQADNASADAMTTRVVFTGEGSQPADEAQREEIFQFAAELFNQSMK
jgi:hypothetical protein